LGVIYHAYASTNHDQPAYEICNTPDMSEDQKNKNT